MPEKIIVRTEIAFDEAVNGTKKVIRISHRQLSIIKKEYARLAKVANQNQELNLKSAELAKELAL